MTSAICFNMDQSKILLSGNGLTLHHTVQTFNDPLKEAFWKPLTAGKEQNTDKQQFILLPHCILLYKREFSVFWSQFNCHV